MVRDAIGLIMTSMPSYVLCFPVCLCLYLCESIVDMKHWHGHTLSNCMVLSRKFNITKVNTYRLDNDWKLKSTFQKQLGLTCIHVIKTKFDEITECLSSTVSDCKWYIAECDNSYFLFFLGGILSWNGFLSSSFAFFVRTATGELANSTLTFVCFRCY